MYAPLPTSIQLPQPDTLGRSQAEHWHQPNMADCSGHHTLAMGNALSPLRSYTAPNSSRSKTWQPFIRADQLLYLIASRRQAACSVLLRPTGDATSFFPAKAADMVPLSGLASKARGRSRDEGREQEPEPPKEMEPKDPKRPPMGDLGHSSRISDLVQTRQKLDLSSWQESCQRLK